MAKIYGIAIGKHFMAERETHSHLIQLIHLLNGSFGQSNKMHKRKTHKLWGFKSINLHLYCWMYMSTGTCMNLNEYVALVHIVPPEPCPLVPPDMGCVKSCITSVHNNFRYFLLFILYTQCQAPTVSSRFKKVSFNIHDSRRHLLYHFLVWLTPPIGCDVMWYCPLK